AGGVSILGGSVVVGTITSRGGNGGAGGADNGVYGGGNGGGGGFGGSVDVTGSAYSSAIGLFVDGPVTVGNIDVSGGSGGAGGKGLGVSAGIGGNGGNGGSVSVFGGSIDLSSGG